MILYYVYDAYNLCKENCGKKDTTKRIERYGRCVCMSYQALILHAHWTKERYCSQTTVNIPFNQFHTIASECWRAHSLLARNTRQTQRKRIFTNQLITQNRFFCFIRTIWFDIFNAQNTHDKRTPIIAFNSTIGFVRGFCLLLFHSLIHFIYIYCSSILPSSLLLAPTTKHSQIEIFAQFNYFFFCFVFN